MKAIFFLVVGLAAIAIQFLSPGPAVASGPTCQDLFRDSTEADLRGKNFRLSILNNATSLLVEARTEKHKAIHLYRERMRSIEDVSAKSIEKVISKSATLSGLRMDPSAMLPPRLQFQTWKSMNDPSLSLGEIVRILSTEPYFEWLQHNSFASQTTPIANYLKSRSEGLEPEMALVRMQKAFDPTVAAESLKWADVALHHDAVMRVIQREVIDWLASADSAPSGEWAWRQIPTLNAGRANLRDLLDQQVRLYGKHFSRSEYELVFTARGQTFQSAIANLATQLGPHVSYEAILAEYFDPKAAEKIMALRKFVEIAEAFRTKESSLAYIKDQVLNEGVRK